MATTFWATGGKHTARYGQLVRSANLGRVFRDLVGYTLRM